MSWDTDPTKAARESMQHIHKDPGNEIIYLQRALAYAAIAIAEELSEIRLRLEGNNAATFEVSDRVLKAVGPLARIADSLEGDESSGS